MKLSQSESRFESDRSASIRLRDYFVKALAKSTDVKSKLKLRKGSAFNALDFLDSAGVARKVTKFKKKEAVLTQGDPAKNVLYIQKGGIRLSVVNETGKEAVVSLLSVVLHD